MTNSLTASEEETLLELSQSFSAAQDYIARILKGDDVQGNLYYIVHDWIGERGQPYNRNRCIVAWLQTMAAALERSNEAVVNASN